MGIITLVGAGSRNAALTGTTAAERPELAGVVLEDQLRPFEAGSVRGVLQDRVVRSDSTGLLAFYSWIRELSPGANLDQSMALDYGWSVGHIPPTADCDFRIDGLGETGPESVLFDGIRLHFQFPRAFVTSTAISRFMFVIFPGVTEYETGGAVLMSASAWFARIPNCFRPVFTSARPAKESKKKKPGK